MLFKGQFIKYVYTKRGCYKVSTLITVSAQIEGRPSIKFSRFKTAALFQFGQSAGLIKLPLYWLAALEIIIFVSY